MNGSEYIWQHPDWPRLHCNIERLVCLLSQVHRAHGHLLGRLEDIGMEPHNSESQASTEDKLNLQVSTEDVLNTSEIEGERLNPATVRSSVARRLGIDVGALAPADRHVDGVVDMVLDATARFDQPLTDERLFSWHAALFPAGYGGLRKIRVGDWRDDAQGPMQVVSGPASRERVHYEAPPANRIEAQMADFLSWFNTVDELDPLIKAGLAHLRFVTIHPFDDGNGRIARAVGDMALARADRSPLRCYSLSAQIRQEREDYYDRLERAQKGSLDATDWLEWFLACLLRAMQGADDKLSAVFIEARYRRHWADIPMNERQIKLLNRLLDGFYGKLTSSKWAKIAKCSQHTAQRDIAGLLRRGVLLKSDAGGRSTSYQLKPLD